MRIAIVLLNSLVLTMLIAPFAAAASVESVERYVITVPGQGWNIAFDALPLRQFEAASKGKDFQYRAAGDNFNVSLFVEAPQKKEAGNEAVYDHYWPLAKQNPIIDQASVKVSKVDKRFVKVTYNIKADGTVVPNVNYYFAFEGRWIDVHASRFPPGKDDEAIFAQFEKSLSYQATKGK